ncbi:fused MFS/spermidine synthase [uncultured Eubacterium sp.]|uniref:spermidine synthase n=1 Tax=uncultured Eubacterium sp. TaxID=165185 RepID=UPI0033901C04
MENEKVELTEKVETTEKIVKDKETVNKNNRLLNNKLFLYLTEFFSGMAVMAVELGASRLLAPYFSSSQIVWTIIIGTIMIAMALGNIYGGRYADKNPDPDKLYGRIIISGIWIALIPVLGKYIIVAISAILIFTVNSNFLIIAGFIACMVIFVFPLFLLGTVTPSLVKYTTDSLDDNAKVVGNLGAANTIGSIIGTFVPTFISIPAVGTSITFLVFAGILLVISFGYFLIGKQNNSKRRLTSLTIFGIVYIVACIFGHNNSYAFWENKLTYEGESIYNYLQVYEDEDEVALSTNVLFGVQSVYMKDKKLTGMYYDIAMASLYFSDVKRKDNLDILVLGMGTGTYATQSNRYFDNLNIEGVEIDKKIIDLSRKHFDLDKNVKVTEYDGRAFLNVNKKKYDVIMVDAYQDITIPFQMSSVEFFDKVREHLTDDGVMVVNINMRSDKKGSINNYLEDTIAQVFKNVYTVKVDNSTNVELFAGNNKDMLKVFNENVSLEDNEELIELLESITNRLEEYEAGNLILTDDKAPVELLGIDIIDDLIKDEVEYYREIYKKDGIKGLIDQL